MQNSLPYRKKRLSLSNYGQPNVYLKCTHFNNWGLFHFIGLLGRSSATAAVTCRNSKNTNTSLLITTLRDITINTSQWLVNSTGTALHRFSLSETEKIASENAMIAFTFHFSSHNSKISFSYIQYFFFIQWWSSLHLLLGLFSVILKLKLLTESVKQEKLRKGKKVTIFTNLRLGFSDLSMAQNKYNFPPWKNDLNASFSLDQQGEEEGSECSYKIS